MAIITILPVARIERPFDPAWRDQAMREGERVVALANGARPPRSRPCEVHHEVNRDGR